MDSQIAMLSEILMGDTPTHNLRANKKVESFINISVQVLEILSSHLEMAKELSENSSEQEWIHFKNKSKTLWKAFQSYGTYGRKTFHAVLMILQDALTDGLDVISSEAIGIFEIAERYEFIDKVKRSGIAPELDDE